MTEEYISISPNLTDVGSVNANQNILGVPNKKATNGKVYDNNWERNQANKK
jgi:hypothetical protein